MNSLAVDCGQTGSRLLLSVAGRSALLTAGGFAYAAADPAATVNGNIADAWQHGPKWTVPAVGIGLTGEYDDTQLRTIAAATARLCGAAVVRIAHDSVTAHVGALGGRPGMVVMAGTGVVALTVGPDRSVRRVDGLGHLLGDDGGGFFVGQRALRAALAAADGRGPQTLLHAMAIEAFGPLDDLAGRLNPDPAAVSRIAGFSRPAAQAARAGDEIAVRIWQDAVAALVTTSRAALSGWPAATVSWAGALFDVADLIREPWLRAMREQEPRAVFTTPAGDCLGGARLLAERDDLDHLCRLVYRV